MTQGWVARVVAVLAVVGFTAVGAVSPAIAAGAISVASITVENRAYGENYLNQTLNAPNGHTIRVQVPQPLANFWYGVGNAVCTPANELVGITERNCTMSNPEGTAIIRYKFPVTPEDLADQTFTVTVTDLDSDPQSSDTGTVSVVRRADLDLAYFVVVQAGPVNDFHPQVQYSHINHGPTASLAATLTLSFSGSVVFGSLPQGCTVAGMVVTCALGYQAVNSPRGPIALDLGAASGSFTVHGVLASPTQDPDSGNNSRQGAWQALNNPTGGSGGSGGGGSGGSGGGATSPANTAPGTSPPATGASPSTAPSGSAAPPRSLEAQPAAAVNNGSQGGLWWVAVAVVGVAVALGVGFVLLRRRGAVSRSRDGHR